MKNLYSYVTETAIHKAFVPTVALTDVMKKRPQMQRILNPKAGF